MKVISSIPMLIVIWGVILILVWIIEDYDAP